MFNGEMSQSAFDYGQILTEEEEAFLNDVAVSHNSHIGFGFTAILTTINFMLSAAVSKMRMMSDWAVNMNTYMLGVGPKSCGKSPAVKTFVKDPLKEIDESWQKQVCNMKSR